MFVKHMFVRWPNRQTLYLSDKISNVCQIMLARLARALKLVTSLTYQKFLCTVELLYFSNETSTTVEK